MEPIGIITTELDSNIDKKERNLNCYTSVFRVHFDLEKLDCMPCVARLLVGVQQFSWIVVMLIDET